LERELNISTEFNAEKWTREIEEFLERKRAELPTPQLPTQTFSSAIPRIASLVPSTQTSISSCQSLSRAPLFSLDLNLAANLNSTAPVFPPYLNSFGFFLPPVDQCPSPCASSNSFLLF